MSQKNNIAVFILAGGKSSRMGSDKGLIELSGKSLAQHVIDAGKTVSDSVYLVANNTEYKNFRIPVINDLILDKGPMGGIYTALSATKLEWNMFLSCDIPLIKSDILKLLSDNIQSDYDAIIVKHNNTIEPLCGIYNKSLKDFFQVSIEQEKLSITKALAELKVKYVEIPELESRATYCFKNINTPQDLKEVKEVLHG